MLKLTTATANKLLNATPLKTQLTLGKLYIYAGTVPATADEALNMVTTHTELVIVTNNATATGLTLDDATAGVLTKAAAETWSGTPAFSGFNTVSPGTPTFYRFCAAGDDGRAVANATTGYRVQGTVGGPSSGADLVLAATTITSGTLQPIGSYGLRITG